MPPLGKLLETVKCLDGSVFHLEYHQKRVNASRRSLGYTTGLELQLSPPRTGLYRCRIIYAKEIEKIEYIPYRIKEIHTFKLLHSDISYELKYENREQIEALLKKKENADDIIIVKEGLITDTSIANLCFFDGKEWLTPKKPLLKGTTRQRLIDTKKIKTADIHYKDIDNYSKIALMNAMIDFYIIEDAIIT